MRKILLPVLVAAASAAFLLPDGRAGAMTPAAPSQLGLAGTDSMAVQEVSWHRRWHAHDWRPRDHWGRRWYWGWPVPSSELYIRPWPRHGWRPRRHYHHHWHRH